MKDQRRIRSTDKPFFNIGYRRGEWSSSRPSRFSGNETRYPLYKRLVWPQSQGGRLLKMSSLPGYNPGTKQHVESRYTDWAILT